MGGGEWGYRSMNQHTGHIFVDPGIANWRDLGAQYSHNGGKRKPEISKSLHLEVYSDLTEI